MNDRPLGPWMRLYADFGKRKAHYTDAQFRALILVFNDATTLRNHLPSRRALTATYGKAAIDFLFEEGDLVEQDGEVVVQGWSDYQARNDPTNAERQRRWRDNHPRVTRYANGGDELVTTSTYTVTSSSSPPYTEDVPVAADFNDDWVWVTNLAESKTGRAYALGAPTSKLGAMALAQVADFGRAAVDEAWSTVNSHRPNLNVMLAINQLVLGADNLLRPIPRVNGKQLAAEEQGKRDREAAERRRAATRKLIDEQRAREH